MSAFSDWYSGFVHIYPISQQDVDYMEQAFYAGMDHAEKLVNRIQHDIPLTKGQLSGTQHAKEAIRKEIE